MELGFEYVMRHLLFILFLPATISVYSQVSINSCGGDVVQPNVGSISYSVGQLDYLSTTTTTYSISAGVQQPVKIEREETNISPLSKKDYPDLSVTPNPTKDNVTVIFPLQGEYQYILTDMNGKKFDEGRLVNGMILSMQNYLPGTYLLNIISVKDNNFSIAKKIIKE